MNPENPATVPVEPAASPAPYRDWSTGLLIFGILTILMGCVCALFVPFMLLGQVMSSRTAAEPPPFSAIIPAVLVYVILAVALIWTGIGSMLARRWARALLLILSWSWLVMGIIAMVVSALVMPTILANPPARNGMNPRPLPAGAMAGVMVFTLVILGFIFVVLPAIWTFFYSNRHVKATCLARDPVARWTDACPLPVLAACLWMWFSVISMVAMPFCNRAVAPFFGMFLSGLAGAALLLAFAAAWGIGGWRLYRLDMRGWWLVVIIICVFAISGVLTYARHDISEMYRLMGYSDKAIADIQRIGLINQNRMMAMTIVSSLLMLGYLLYIRKFLRPAPGQTQLHQAS